MMEINAVLGHHIGALESSFVAHVVGSIFAFFILIKPITQGAFFQKAKHIPWRLYTCGMLGVFLVYATNILVLQLGLVLTVAIVITASLVTSVLADHFGLLQNKKFPINRHKIIGILCACIGFMLVLKG
jgi:bacterial/archaeal transporter family-2 protein